MIITVFQSVQATDKTENGILRPCVVVERVLHSHIHTLRSEQILMLPDGYSRSC